MTPVQIALALLEALVQLVPGALQAITALGSDEEALRHAREQLAQVQPLAPEIARLAARRRAELASHRAALTPLLSGASLTLEERTALSAVLRATDRDEP